MSPLGHRPAAPNPGQNLAPAIVKLRASNLTILSSWTVPTSEQTFGDEDFGGTPTLFTATINGVQRQLVGAIDEDGLFFAWDRSDLAAGPLSAMNDRQSERQSALDPLGRLGRQVSVCGRRQRDHQRRRLLRKPQRLGSRDRRVRLALVQDFMTGGITEIPGMIIEGVGAGGQVKFLNTANGATVFTFNSGSMVQGEVTVSNSMVSLQQANGNLMAAGL